MEYKVVEVAGKADKHGGHLEIETIEENVNDAATLGWKLASSVFVQNKCSIILFFERRIGDE